MNVLGLHGVIPNLPGIKLKPPPHNSNISLIVDSKYVGSFEQERFSRKKHDNIICFNTIENLLKKFNLSKNDIDVVVYVLNENYIHFFSNNNEYLFNDKKILEEYIKNQFSNSVVKFVDHHLAHSMGAFLTSNFQKSNLLSLDGTGTTKFHLRHVLELNISSHYRESNSGFFGTANNDPFEIVKFSEFNDVNNCVFFDEKGKLAKEVLFANSNVFQSTFSLGNFYFYISNLIYRKILKKIDRSYQTYSSNPCHQIHEGTVGKIMGLRGFGKQSKISAPEIITVDRTSNFEMPVFLYNYGFVDYFYNYLDKHKPEEIAFWLQETFEEIVLKFLRLVPKNLKLPNLCFSGGCALNILLNERILKEKLYDNLHIHPSTSDNGLSLGAALLYAKENNISVQIPKNLGCVGLEYNNDEIKKFLIYKDNKNYNFFELLKSFNLNYKEHTFENVYQIVASALNQNKIIGWFQGKSEFGPRALGNRSILSNPTFDNKQLLNEKVKVREFWRPYAAVVLEEYQDEWFNLNKKDSYYMLFGGIVLKDKIQLIPAVTHVDDTCRIQTVNKEMNEHLYLLLNEFYKISQIPLLLNTSFNTLKGEPIVETPVDAVKSFINSKMDMLVINNYIITKEEDETYNGKTFPIQTN